MILYINWLIFEGINWLMSSLGPTSTGEDSIEDSLSGAYGGLARFESTRSASYLGRDFFAVHVDPVWRLKGEPTLVNMGMVGELYNLEPCLRAAWDLQVVFFFSLLSYTTNISLQSARLVWHFWVDDALLAPWWVILVRMECILRS